MKKLVSLLLVAAMVLSSVSVFAVEATHHEIQNNIFVEGKVEQFDADNNMLNLTITKDGELLYIEEYEIGANGEYAIKFKCEGNLEGAQLKVKYAAEDVTDSVVNATSTSQIMEAEVFVADENDKGFATSVDTSVQTIQIPALTYNGVNLPAHTYTTDYRTEERTGLKAVVNLTNKFGYADKVDVMVAAYDENNQLLACKLDTVDAQYGYNGENQVLETAVIDVPANTVSAKAFCWNSVTKLIPYGKESDGTLPKVDIFCIGDSFCQTYGRRFYPESGWSGHLIDYFNKDLVTVTNYGTSGAWAQAVLSNKNDPVYQANVAAGNNPTSGLYGWNDWAEMEADPKFSEGDYVIVSLGLNDSGKPGPDGMSAVDWYGLGIEEMIARAKAKNVNIILCSALLRANMWHPAGTQELVDRTEEIAEAYGVPYLAVSDAQTAQYAEEFGYEIGKSYTPAEEEVYLKQIYSKYYLDREAFKDPNHEFHLTDEERANHEQAAMKDDHASGRNSHPSLRGADNMARLMAQLLKDTDSSLRFYVK